MSHLGRLAPPPMVRGNAGFQRSPSQVAAMLRPVVRTNAGFQRPPSEQLTQPAVFQKGPGVPYRPAPSLHSHKTGAPYRPPGRSPDYRPTGKSSMGYSRMTGVQGLDQELAGASLQTDAPIMEQEIVWDMPSLTLYVGTNKIALVPALLSALAVRLILFGGGKISSLVKGDAPTGKRAKA